MRSPLTPLAQASCFLVACLAAGAPHAQSTPVPLPADPVTGSAGLAQPGMDGRPASQVAGGAEAGGAAAVRGADLAPVEVRGHADGRGLPHAYAGGQVSHGGRAGVLGEREALDTPFSVTGFTDQMRRDRQATSIGELVEYMAGVSAAQTGGNTQNDVLYFRGFRTSTGNGAVDGLPGLLNRQAPVEPFERFEVLLGPSAFINGRPDNVGGTLNLSPKRAPEAPLARVGMGYITGGTWSLGADLGRRFGPDGATGVRLNVAQQEGDSPVRPGSRRASTASLGLDWRSRDVRLGFDYVYNTRFQQPGVSLNITPLNTAIPIPAAPDARHVFTLPWTQYARQYHLALGRAEWDFAPGWTASVAYGAANDAEQNITSSDRLVDSAGRVRFDSVGTSRSDTALRSGEAMVRGAIDTGPVQHKVALGYNRYTRETLNGFNNLAVTNRFSNLYAPASFPIPVTSIAALLPNPINDTTTSSAFLSDEVLLLQDRLRLLVGLRRTSIDQNIYNGTTGVRTSNYDSSKNTPALGIVYRVQPNVALYGNYVKSLEQGAIAGTARANAGELFPPTTARQVEAGVKGEFGGFGTTLAIYEIDRASLITDTATNRLLQDGRQVNRGVELSTAGEIARGLRVYAGLTRISAKTQKTAGGLYDGRTATGVPRYTATAYADWDVPGVPGLALSGGMVRVGAQQLDASNARVLKGWTRFDAGLRYSARMAERAVVWRLGIANLTNRNYWAAADLGTLYLGAPRVATLSATIDF